MRKKLLRPVVRNIRGFRFFIRSMQATKQMTEIPLTYYGKFILTGLSTHKISELDNLFRSIRNGPPLPFWKKALFKYRGTKLCGVILDRKKNLVGFQLHSYINYEMLKKNILYLEFSATAPDQRNQGLASKLKKHMASHFATQGITGILAATARNNYAELKAAECAGYKIIDNPNGSKKIAKLYLELSGL